jgi:hypothetical protein
MDESIKLKRGHVREDGMVFACYHKDCVNGEWWVTKEKFAEMKQKQELLQKEIKRKNLLERKEKHSRGKKNAEGLVFWKYSSCGSPIWMEEKDFIKRLEENKKKNKIYRDANKDKAKEYSQKQSQRIYENNKRWRENNRERYNATWADWSKKHPESRNAFAAHRRALKRNAIHPEHDFADDKKLCQIIQILKPVENLHIDHIIPLSRNGIHHIYNLRLLPAKLNYSKNDKLDSELTPEQQQECYFWRILTRFLTCSYDYANAA